MVFFFTITTFLSYSEHGKQSLIQKDTPVLPYNRKQFLQLKFSITKGQKVLGYETLKFDSNKCSI